MPRSGGCRAGMARGTRAIGARYRPAGRGMPGPGVWSGGLSRAAVARGGRNTVAGSGATVWGRVRRVARTGGHRPLCSDRGPPFATVGHHVSAPPDLTGHHQHHAFAVHRRHLTGRPRAILRRPTERLRVVPHHPTRHLRAVPCGPVRRRRAVPRGPDGRPQAMARRTPRRPQAGPPRSTGRLWAIPGRTTRHLRAIFGRTTGRGRDISPRTSGRPRAMPRRTTWRLWVAVRRGEVGGGAQGGAVEVVRGGLVVKGMGVLGRGRVEGLGVVGVAGWGARGASLVAVPWGVAHDVAPLSVVACRRMLSGSVSRRIGTGARRGTRRAESSSACR
ncbi:hypothetical protein BJ982_004571 [Sphaerisporangium siamense]|uniref:Uncharacterized protein n=1 Tax=Sphaerisporangium siamense TaxID=795645 RepID=A0A7W7GB35_9ACTN|nr:hypothetical protein [Sphaerisporangium siamense]